MGLKRAADSGTSGDQRRLVKGEAESGVVEFAGALPDARGEEQTYFDYCQEGRLMIQRCPRCHRYVFYPRSVCPYCLSLSLEWVEARGTGTVYTFTVQYRDPPGFEGQAPYVVAMIELDEGVRVMSRVVGDPARVRIGLLVRVEFARISDGFQVPVFLPVEEGGRG